MDRLYAHPIVVTGLGIRWFDARSPGEFWQHLTFPPNPTPTRVDLADIEVDVPAKQRRRSTPVARLATATGLAAVGDADGTKIAPERAAIVVGAGFDVTDFNFVADSVLSSAAEGPRKVSPSFAITTMPNIGAAHLSKELGWTGPSQSVAAGCASSTVAICCAANLLVTHQADVALVGGATLMRGDILSPIAVLSNLRVHSASTVSRPFDIERSGFVHSEGAAFLVLETADHAKGRGVGAYASLLGWASATDPSDLVAPSSGGPAMVACYRRSLEMAGVEPRQVGWVNPHGSGTRVNDLAEARALETVFGTGVPLVSATKATTGHLSSAAGTIEAMATVLSFVHRAIPPTPHTRNIDPDCAVRLVQHHPQEWTPQFAMSSNLGLGGHNAALVFGPPPRDVPTRAPTHDSSIFKP